MPTTPEGFSTLTSVIISKNAQVTIDGYQKVLGAEISGIMNNPETGKVCHACLKMGESTLFIADECPEMNVQETGRQEFYLYVENADQVFEKAKSVGWEIVNNPEDMFWGDRIGTVKDQNGHTWKLAQRVRDVSPEEMEKAMKQ